MGAVGGGTEGWRQRALRVTGFEEMSRTHRLESMKTVGLLALMALVLGAATDRIQFSGAFYDAVAQVIPVLLLAVAIEERVFRDRPTSDAFIRFGLRVLLISAVVGEAACLAVIAHGSDPLVLRGMVLTGLLLVGVLFVLVALRELEPKTSATSEGAPTPRMANSVAWSYRSSRASA